MKYVRRVSYPNSHMAYDKGKPHDSRQLQGKKVPISTYLDVGLYDAVFKLAQKNERPLAAEIRLAIRAHVEAKAA